jgi:predicted ABC-type ATPase
MVGGPNGSGKTTLVEYLRGAIALPLGHYLNPDALDYELVQSGRIDFARWGVDLGAGEFLRFVEHHPLFARAQVGLLRVEQNAIVPAQPVPPGYLASIISDFMRRHWLGERASFTFETVMSSGDKIDLLAEAHRIGYRSYLYYVCTETPAINQRRIANRVRDGGHDVPADKIVHRYERSLALLPEAIRLSDRAYLFDNSGQSHRMFVEFESGRPINTPASPPEWFQAMTI